MMYIFIHKCICMYRGLQQKWFLKYGYAPGRGLETIDLPSMEDKKERFHYSLHNFNSY